MKNILEENYDRYAPYSEQIRIPFLFQGQYYDHETELAYNRFRYYSPELGRYISEDPIQFESGTTALHSYVDDSNVRVDLLGLASYKKMSDQEIQALGLDAHEIKRDFMGKKSQISHFDLYKDTETKTIVILRKGGSDPPIDTGIPYNL